MSHGEAHEEVDGIAIVGMSCRFPQAASPDEFWRNLRAGVEALTFFSPEDLAAEGIDPAILQHPDYVGAGMLLDGVDLFDAGFFGYSPRDAELLDPQQRIFLEAAWSALEDAGCDPQAHPGLIGVYAGTAMSQYLFNLFGNAEIMASAGRFQVQLGNDKDHISTRTAYKLDLKGPAVTVQTTCSTSLVAVCQACQALLTWQCDVALAGGCSIQLPQRSGYMYQEGGISSPDGHCRAFDAQAKGTVGGSGAGVVALKRMEDALRDGDQVYAVIRGFGINNDGSDKVGYTAPSVAGQAGAITLSLAMAGVEPDTIGYVEAHGTGTPLGDPIEVAALTRAFRTGTERTGFCAIGSVKTNIGHLDSAAGVAGLIKAALTLRNGEIPPSLHFQAPNPAIDFAGSPFYVNASLSPWPRGDMPRRAGVSSFGIGGTNAHVTLEEAPVPVSAPASRPWQLLVLSARTANALEDATDRLAERLARSEDVDLADVAWTLQTGRRAFGHRRAVAVPGGDPVEGARRLRARERAADGVAQGAPSIGFLFSGQGAQHAGMGRGLYDTEPVYRAEIDRCAALLRPHLGLDIRTLLHPGPELVEDAAGHLRQTAMAQPALFVVEYALARLWMSWGVRPAAMAGHSIGEYVAACLAGVFSLEDALALVAARGRLMQQMPRGAMAAVFLGEADLLPLLSDELSLAVVNGPSVCVVAGPEDAVSRFEGTMDARGVGTRRLHTSHAFHSAMMDGALEPFAEVVRGMTLHAPTLPLLSNVTGTWMTAAEATDPSYWVRHLRGTVRLADNLAALLEDEERLLLEVGPGRSLRTVAEQHPARGAGQPVLSSLPHPQDGEEDAPFLITTLGRLWAAGASVDWEAFHGGERRLRVPLPTYPFERRRYWVEPDRAPLPAFSAPRDPAGFLYAPVWEDAPLPASAPALPPLRWLVFADAAGLGDALAARLSAVGHDVVTVEAGADAFGSMNGDGSRFVLQPDRPEGYGALLERLRADGRLPDRIIHLWTVAGDDASLAVEDVRRRMGPGFYSLLFLGQALGELPGSPPLRLDVVSTRLQRVEEGDAVDPGNATVLGPIRVLGQEIPNLACRSADVACDGRSTRDGVLDSLLAELSAEASETVVAWRGGTRLVRRWRPAPPQPDQLQERLREGGVYLVTGGLGGIGMVLAGYLARAARAKLVLTGRSPFPAREAWDAWIAEHGEADATSRRIAVLREMEAAGAEVLVVRADAASRDDMKRVAELVRERWGAVHGIVHAAGVPGGGVAALKTVEAAERVLAPKVDGTLVLHEVFADPAPDFVALCSSLASVLGGVGQVDYVAANAFQDAFAHSLAAAGGPVTLALNWDTWREVGMAVETALPADLAAGRAGALAAGLANDEGAAAFALALGGTLPQVAVSTVDLEARLNAGRAPAAAAEAPAPRTAARHPRPPIATPYVAPRDAVEERVAALWAELLGIERVGVDDSFLELGGHSLLAIQAIARIREAFRVEISVRTFFEALTVAALAPQLAPPPDAGENGAAEPAAPTSIKRISRDAHRVRLGADGLPELQGEGVHGR